MVSHQGDLSFFKESGFQNPSWLHLPRLQQYSAYGAPIEYVLNWSEDFLTLIVKRWGCESSFIPKSHKLGLISKDKFRAWSLELYMHLRNVELLKKGTYSKEHH